MNRILLPILLLVFSCTKLSVDDDGDNWNIAYMYGKVYYDFFNPSKNREGTLKELGILADLAEVKELTTEDRMKLKAERDYNLACEKNGGEPSLKALNTLKNIYIQFQVILV